MIRNHLANKLFVKILSITVFNILIIAGTCLFNYNSRFSSQYEMKMKYVVIFTFVYNV